MGRAREIGQAPFVKIVVTGAGGLIGTSLCQRLVTEGHEVWGLARGDYPHLRALGVHTVRADLADFAGMASSFAGAGACFHVAAKVAMWGRWRDFYRANVTGTQNVIRACKDSGVPFLIYTSTPSVVFEDQNIEGGDERLPYARQTYSHYARSKALAEREILAVSGESLRTLALRPHLVFGPRDQNLIPRLVHAARRGRLKIVGEGDNRVDVLFIENAIDAHVQALKKLEARAPVDGRAYFLGQGPVELWPFINRILAHYQIPPVTKKISFKRAFYAGLVLEKGAGLLRMWNVDLAMTRFTALQLARSHYFEHKLAERLLDWRPRISIDEGLARLPFFKE